MKILQFKTNIKCSGCVANVSAELNKMLGEDNWKVDVLSSDKILTVSNEEITEYDILAAVEKAGYKAQKVS